MTNKLISVVGPTAVGKTAFTLELVQALQKIDSSYQGFDIISADSRQVYKDIAIISGADVPEGFTRHDDYFEDGSVRMYGLLDLEYTQEWSLAHFKTFAQNVIESSWSNKRLPILVGGTGLYHLHLFKKSPLVEIPPDVEFRKAYQDCSVGGLQVKLSDINPQRLDTMNESDKHNPTRLLRAIEVEAYLQKHPEERTEDHFAHSKKFDHLVIGLTDSLETIQEKITRRVQNRFLQGAIAEVENLQEKVITFGVNKQITSATGVKEILAYLEGEIEKEVCLSTWSLREYQYAKRQITWWKPRNGINWFKIHEPNWLEKAFELATKFVLSGHS